jgi:Domain of unknown function (DUF4180)
MASGPAAGGSFERMQKRRKQKRRKECRVPDLIREIGGRHVLICAADGAPLASERDATDVISAAFHEQAQFVVIPVARLSDDFFHLSTRLAGEVIQKFVNYNLPLAIVGDISEKIAASNALRDFVTEANRGQTVWFLNDIGELDRRLSSPSNADARAQAR